MLLRALSKCPIKPPSVVAYGRRHITSEPSFCSQGLGLANPWPPGLLQAAMEHLHVAVELPWWATIISTTVVLRVCLLPVVIKSRKAFVTQANLAPQLRAYQQKMMDMSLSASESEKARLEYFEFMTANGVHPKTTLLPLLCNGAVFASMFFAIRGMASLPVESLQTGGTFWFTNLAASDPYFILPVVTATSLLVHLKLGGEGMSLDALPPFMRNMMFALPVISIPLMCSFPAALNLYWMTSNLVTIAQSRLLALESIRSRLGIPKAVQPQADAGGESYDDIRRRIQTAMKQRTKH